MFLMNNTLTCSNDNERFNRNTGKARNGTGKTVTSLDPSGSITTVSPYVQNCSSVNANATGVQIDGNLHSTR